MTNGDTIVVLRSVNKLHATKQFTFIPGKKGKPDQIRNKSYGNEKFFSVDEIPIANAAALHHVLEHLTRDPFAFIIRGAPLPGINRHYTRRLLHKDPKTGEDPNFAPQPRRWLTVDCDHLPEPPLTDLVNRPVDAVQHVIGRLPPELHDVTCFWQLSSSAGLPSSEGSLSLHLWYWCACPYSDEELSRWASFVNREDRLVDAAVYRPVQPHYIAAPLFSGMADPLGRRGLAGIHRDLHDLQLALQRRRQQLVACPGARQLRSPKEREPGRSHAQAHDGRGRADLEKVEERDARPILGALGDDHGREGTG